MNRPGGVIAVCTPGDDIAGTLGAASLLANGLGLSLEAIAAVEPPSELEQLAAALGLSEDRTMERLIADVRARLARASADLPVSPAEIPVLLGRPFLEIVRHAMAHDTAFIVKTIEPPRAGGRGLASTDQHLLRKCPSTVWLRRKGDTQPVRRVVAAIDAADADEEALNTRILQTAARIAALSDATVHAVHAWDAPGEALVRRWTDRDDGPAAARRYTSSVRLNHEAALGDAIEKAGVAAHAEPVHGPADEAVSGFVQSLGADLLVMGTVGRTGVPGLIIGNTAEDILNAVGCAVVTVKPPGYRSPIR
ncbi:MAG: universal stress protein [Pseudomonadota bacterium]